MERHSPLGKHTLEHIASTRGLELKLVSDIAALMDSGGLSKADIYRRLMAGYGVPGSHCSGKTDGELKDGGKNHAHKRFAKRNH